MPAPGRRVIHRSAARRRRRRLLVAVGSTAAAATLAGAAVGANGGDAKRVLRKAAPTAADRLPPPTVASRVAGVATVSIRAPVVAQALRNNCETAALSVLLSTVGVSAGQLLLQRQIERDGPLDPQGPSDQQVWGDPDVGYVGRADGSGPAGGFGVYQRPIMRLAARHGVPLDDLTGASVDTIRARLLAGRAVMAWVGLGEGPYGNWTSPAGKPINVNFNEHTVVLTGVRSDGSFSVVNVLQGTREVWSPALFEQRFAWLGRRAVAPPVGSNA